jgi:CBS domain-containing protein
MAFASPDAGVLTPTLPLMLAAPVANFGMGLLLLGISYASSPGADLLSQPWISPGHILRAFVWMQFVVGVVNLLPAATLPTRQTFRVNAKSAAGTRTSGPVFSLMTGLAVVMLLGGLIITNLWLILLGCFVLLGSQLKTQPAASAVATPDAPNPDSMRVDEVMLTEFIILSSSDTLRGALDRTVHSLQDVFPVIRGDRLVGSITRQTLAEQLLTEGDSYVQGIMTRSLQVAGPHEELVLALRRAGAHGASEFIPVAEEGRMLGILTPQSLTRAVHQVKQTRPPFEAKEPR